MPELSVPYLEKPDVEAFARDFIGPQRPAIIRGAIEGWRARGTWTPEYLRSRFGDREIPGTASDEPLGLTSSLPLQAILNMRVDKVRIGTFLDDLLASRTVYQYVSGISLSRYLPDLLPDVAVPAYHPRPDTTSPRMWLGGPFVGPLHYDRTDNLHAIVHGCKRFRLLPPSQLRNLYVCSILSIVPTMSGATFYPADEARFPRLRKARFIDVDLEAGDMIYLPAGWWHQVTTPVTTISIDFTSPERRQLTWPFLRLAAWRLLRPLRGQLGIK